jgi:hypothetical protein
MKEIMETREEKLIKRNRKEIKMVKYEDRVI